MDFLRHRQSRRRQTRTVRPVPALVEGLERRCLLSLQVGPITTQAGQTFNGQVATFAAGDLQGSLADFQATINWGGALTPSTQGTISANGAGGYVVTGSNVYPQVGTYTLSVTVTGANNTSVSNTGTATVNDATLTTTPATVSPALQTPFSGVVASFESANPYAVASNFTATINWGDGVNTNTPGIVSVASGGGFQVVGQTTYQDAGTFPITVTINSPGGQVNVVNSTANVTTTPVSVFPVPLTGTAGQQLSSVAVATFVDPYLNDTSNSFSASIAWGNGTTSPGTVGGGSNGIYTVTGTNTYETAGTYNVTVQVVRTANDQTASATGQAVIAAATVTPTLVATGTTLLATPGTALPASTVVANFTDTSSAANASNITATIQWGDGQTTNGVVNATSTANDYTVTGGHTYSGTGSTLSYPVSVTITDPSGTTATATSTAVIASFLTATSTTFTTTPGVPLPASTVVANVIDTNPAVVASSDPASLLSAIIDWGDGQSSAGTVNFSGKTASAAAFTVTGSHVYAAGGSAVSYPVTVTIIDPTGQSTSASSTAFVTPPSFTATGTTFSATPGVAVPATTVVANFIDTNPVASASNITATIKWGDGQTTNGVVNATGTASDYTVTGGHTYSATSTNLAYPVSVTITDPSGTTATASSTAVVVSFLTGTGTTFTATPSVPLAASTVVANFTDTNATVVSSSNPGSLVSAIINWGDGQTSPGTVNLTGKSASAATFSVTGSHVYAASGSSPSYPVTVTFIDASGQAITVNSTATVVSYAIVASGTTFATTPGEVLVNQTVATFTDANPGAASSTAVINWGDGTTVQGTVNSTSAPGVYTVSGSHTYSALGSAPSYSVTVTIVDPTGQTASTTSMAQVAPSTSSSASFTGMLAATVNNGPHSAEGFTNTNQPTFTGTAPPFSVVQLYARHFNVDAQLPIGEAVADANGNWTYTTGPLAVGTYIITATYTIPGGYPSNSTTLTNQVANPRTGADDLVYIDLTPRLVRWLSHGQKTTSGHHKAEKTTRGGHTKH